MKIALAQLNYKIADLDNNYTKIINAIDKAVEDKADLIIFSELAICGYFPYDILENKLFVQRIWKLVNKIASYTKDIAVIIGFPFLENNSNKLLNVAAFIYDNKIQTIVNKLIDGDNEFSEENKYFSYFPSSNIVKFKDKKIIISIGTDSLKKINTQDVDNSDFIVNINACKYNYDLLKNRDTFLQNCAKNNSCPLVFVNQVGANDGDIYDGASCVYTKEGAKILQAKLFEDDLQYVDTEQFHNSENVLLDLQRDKISDIYSALILGIRDYVKKSGFNRCVIGFSGGIDSALTLALAVKALGNENVVALLMPTCYSSQSSIYDSIEMLSNANVKYHIINIDKLRLKFLESLKEVFNNTKVDTTEENIQARIRGSILMAYSNKFGHIVLNTSNKSEEAVGYSTLYGDMNGAISVLGDLYKTDVYKLSNYINLKYNNIIPSNIITKEPSAELKYEQKDTDSLPDYEILDKILVEYLDNKKNIEEIINMNIDEAVVKKIIKLVHINEYKRYQAPPSINLSSSSFKGKRKYPIVSDNSFSFLF